MHGRTVLGRGVLKYPMRFHIGEKAADETQLEGEEPVWHKAGVWRAAGTKQKTGASRPAEAGQMPETGAKEGVQVQNGTAACKKSFSMIQSLLAIFYLYFMKIYEKGHPSGERWNAL